MVNELIVYVDSNLFGSENVSFVLQYAHKIS